MPLYTILLAMGNPTVHYFSLDIEGAEFPVLQTIPWDKVGFLEECHNSIIIYLLLLGGHSCTDFGDAPRGPRFSWGQKWHNCLYGEGSNVPNWKCEMSPYTQWIVFLSVSMQKTTSPWPGRLPPHPHPQALEESSWAQTTISLYGTIFPLLRKPETPW